MAFWSPNAASAEDTLAYYNGTCSNVQELNPQNFRKPLQFPFWRAVHFLEGLAKNLPRTVLILPWKAENSLTGRPSPVLHAKENALLPFDGGEHSQAAKLSEKA